MTNLTDELSGKLDPLRPFVEKTAHFQFDGEDIFSACLIASFVRTFEFVENTVDQGPDNSFFSMSALRGMTEDVIYFRFLSQFSHQTRNRITTLLMCLEVMEQTKRQYEFFRTFRPPQRVLGQSSVDPKEYKDELLCFWRSNGWPRLKNRTTPSVRELAEKSDPGLLAVVYDFIYRLTSGLVHFNPQVLLRFGWGDMPKEGTISARFSTKNIAPYYLEVSQVSGSYLLCLYFELFNCFLKPDKDVTDAVGQLREHLLRRSWWPEMVTFEEMNVDRPQPTWTPIGVAVHLFYNELMKEGFLAGARQVLAGDLSAPSASRKRDC